MKKIVQEVVNVTYSNFSVKEGINSVHFVKKRKEKFHHKHINQKRIIVRKI